MAFIDYLPFDEIPPADQVKDRDNIIQIHGIHSRVLRLHYDLYVELMHGESPLSLVEREMVGVCVSALNGCHY